MNNIYTHIVSTYMENVCVQTQIVYYIHILYTKIVKLFLRDKVL